MTTGMPSGALDLSPEAVERMAAVLDARVVRVRDPASKPFKPTLPILQTIGGGEVHKAGDSAGYDYFTPYSAGAWSGHGVFVAQHMIYVHAEPDHEAAATLRALKQSETEGWRYAKELEAELARVQAEREAMREDAERYRWLREQNAKDPSPYDPDVGVAWVELASADGRYTESKHTVAELDAAIDAAMKDKP